MGRPPQVVGLRPKIQKALEPVESTVSRPDSEANTFSTTVVARCPAGIAIRVLHPASTRVPVKAVRHGTRTLAQRPRRASKRSAQTHKSTLWPWTTEPDKDNIGPRTFDSPHRFFFFCRRQPPKFRRCRSRYNQTRERPLQIRTQTPDNFRRAAVEIYSKAFLGGGPTHLKGQSRAIDTVP